MKTLKALGFLGLVIVALVTVTPTAMAFVGCVTSSVAGSWRLYEVFLEEEVRAYQHCELEVASDGSIVAGTQCVTAQGQTLFITGGYFEVQSDCSVEGAFSDVYGTTEIDSAQLNYSHGTLTGVGRVPGIDSVYFSAVRRVVP